MKRKEIKTNERPQAGQSYVGKRGIDIIGV